MQIKNLSQEVMDSVRSELLHFLVPIFGSPSPQLQLDSLPIGGSGTLVQINNVHFILTAAHVWHLLKKSEYIFFLLKNTPSAFTIPRDGLTERGLCTSNCLEWGPDLALLEIAQVHVPTISASKSFLNLSHQRTIFAEHPPKTEKGLWAVTGLVHELGSIQHNYEARTSLAQMRGHALFSTVKQTYHRGGYDYFDIGAKMSLSDVPESFGGVSGGGLWQIDLNKDKSGNISWNGKRYLRGVAFWESGICNGRRVIRCHGPKSLFETAWREWGLSGR